MPYIYFRVPKLESASSLGRVGLFIFQTECTEQVAILQYCKHNFINSVHIKPELVDLM